MDILFDIQHMYIIAVQIQAFQLIWSNLRQQLKLSRKSSVINIVYKQIP